MSEHLKEHVWTVAENETPAAPCQSCSELLHPGELAVSCPRCKGLHHFSCWTAKGGCATHGCFQLADPSLMEGKKRTFDPPAKDSFSWLPVAITVFLVVLVISGAIWASVRSRSVQHTLTVMVPVGSDLPIIQQVAEEFDAKHSDFRVSVLSIPVDSQNMYYEQKLVIMLAAREAPDIILLPRDRFIAYVQQDVLAELDNTKPAISKVVPYGKRLNNGVVTGHLYGIPHPSKPGLFAIPKLSKKAESARQLLLNLVKALPYQAGVTD